MVGRLHRAWSARQPVVIALAVDPGSFRAAATWDDAPWTLGPWFEPWIDRLHFLVWANTYDARDGEPVWWWARKAARLRRRRDAGRAGRRRAGRRPAGVGRRRPAGAARGRGRRGVVHSESVELGRLAARPAPRGPDRRPGARPAGRRRPRRRPGAGHRPGGIGQDPGAHRAPAPPAPSTAAYERETLLAVAYNKQAQQEMEARTSDIPAPGADAQRARLLAAGRGPGPRSPGARRARGAPAGRGAGPGPAPPGQHRPARSLPRGAVARAAGPARPGRGRGRAGRRPRPGRRLRPVPRAAGRTWAPSTSTSRSTPPSSSSCATASSGAGPRPAAATCWSTSSRTSRRPTCCWCGCWPRRASTCSAWATTTRSSTATPAPTRRSSSTSPACSPAPPTTRSRSTTAARSRSSTPPATCSSYNRRRVAKVIRAGPAADPDAGALQRAGAPARGRGDRAGRRRSAPGWPSPASARQHVAVLARVNSLLLAPHVALAEAGIPVDSVLRPDVLERTGVRGRARLPAHRRPARRLRRRRRGRGPPPADARASRSGSRSGSRRRSSTSTGSRGIADRLDDRRSAARCLQLADDLRLVVDAVADRHHPRRAAGGARRHRPRRGHGPARPLRRRRGRSSHLDDLEALGRWPTSTPTRPDVRARGCARRLPPGGRPRRRHPVDRSTGSRAGSGTASRCSASPTA